MSNENSLTNSELKNDAKAIVTQWSHDDVTSGVLHELLHDADNKLTPEAAGVFYKYYNDVPPSNLTVALGLIEENPDFAQLVLDRATQEQAKASSGSKSWAATVAAEKSPDNNKNGGPSL